MKAVGLLPISYPDQCCADHCLEDIGVHDVSRDTAEFIAKKVAERETDARRAEWDEGWVSGVSDAACWDRGENVPPTRNPYKGDS